MACAAGLLLVRRAFEISREIGFGGVATQAQRDLIGFQQWRRIGGMGVVTGGAVILIGRNMAIGLFVAFPNVLMAMQTQVIQAALQSETLRRGGADGMTGLAIFVREGRVLQRHKQTLRFGGVGIVAGRAIGVFKIIALMDGGKSRIYLMTACAQGINVLPGEPGIIRAMRLMAGRASPRAERGMLHGILLPFDHGLMAFTAQILLAGEQLIRKLRGMRFVAAQACAFQNRIMHYLPIRFQCFWSVAGLA